MADQSRKPVLQKPPGYRDPITPAQRGVPRPPPRKPVLPPSFHPTKRRRSCRRVCCCTLFLLILVLILIGAVAFGLLYLWFQPRLPVFHLQSFRIPQLNVTVKADGSYLDAHTIARFEMKNPNGKLSLFYKQSHVEVTAGKEETALGSTDVMGFTQGKRNTTSLKLETRVTNQLVDDGEGSRLKSSFSSKDLVVNLNVKSGVGLIVDGFRIGPLAVKVSCGGVSFKRLHSGDTPKCTVTTLKW